MNQRGLVVLAVCLSFPSYILAQVSTGTITGVVTDTGGAVLPKAQVVITDVKTNITRNLMTDSAGVYTAPNLQPDEYSVQLAIAGFQTQTKTGLALSIGQTITLNFTLLPGTQKESVEVVGLAQQLVDTTTSTLGTVMTSVAVENIPLNSRNFLDLIPLVPGAQPGAQGRNLTQNAFSINGGRVTANGFQIDGADIDTPSNDPLRLYPNLEGIGEFQVLTNDFSAEYGRSMGGIVDVKLRTGTNHLHGSVFEFIRNTDLDASQAFAGQPGPLPYIFNQFGGSAGGPIFKNKLFLFADYQGERIRQSVPSYQNVPLVAEDQPSGGFANGVPQGNYDWSATPTPIFNPYVFPRTQFPNNQIPANLVDPTTALMFSYFPAPNQSCGLGNVPGCPFNYITQVATPVDVDSGDLHLDYTLSTKDQLSFGMIASDTRTNGGVIFPGNEINGNEITQISTTNERLFSVNYTRVLSSSMVNELNFAYAIDRLDAPVSQGMQYQSSIAGLGGLNTNPNNPFTSGFPLLDILGAFSTTFAGGAAGGPSKQHHDIPQFQDNFSFVRGRHSFKTGFIGRFREYNLQQPLFPRGLYAFNSYTTSDFFVGGDPFASALLGVPLLAEREELTYGAFGERDKEYGAYFQDDFKVNRRFTLNLGIRWDLYKPATEENNHTANFDPATVMMIFPASGSPSTLNTNWHDFGPHVGFAYALTDDGKTSLRAGYGIAYLQLVNQAVGTITDRLVENPPFNIAIGGAAIIPNIIGIPVQTVSQGIPLVQSPNPAIPPAGASVVYIPRSQPTPYTQQWTLDIQHELPKNVLIDVAYVRTAGVHLTGSTNLNQGAPGGGASPISPNIAQVEALLNVESSNYNALQVKAEHRFSSGLYVLGTYVYSRAIDDGSTTTQGDLANGNNSEPQNAFDFMAERGPSDSNATHRFVASYVYDLPFGKGKKFANGISHAMDEAIGGWQINGATVVQSGLPFSPLVSAGDAAINAGPAGPVRPDIVGDPNEAGPVAGNPTCSAPTSIHNATAWFNPCAYVVPTNAFGNAGRNSLVGPGFVNFNFSIFKNFALTERYKMQFRTEFFNIFNHTNLGLPNPNIDQAGAGLINTTINQAQLTAQTSRLVQFALKLTF